MDVAIPLATFETTKVRVGPLAKGVKILLPMTYQEGDVKFHHVTLVLPPLAVKSYDAATGRLALTLPSGAATKFQALQDSILSSVAAQQHTWFPGEPHRSKEELRSAFQPILEHGALSLYCPTQPTNEIPIWVNNEWTKRSPALTAGTQVRIVLRIQGVSFHKHPVTGVWTGKFRIQHRIQSITVLPKP
jgi:hypothetical protein